MKRKYSVQVLMVLFLTTVFLACSGQRGLNETDLQEEVPEATQEVVEEEQPQEEEKIVYSYDEETLWASYQERANKALEHLLMAQIAMEGELYNSALYQVNLSLAILQTADGFAYKGSILYMLDRHDEAKTFWEKAWQLNPEALNTNLPGIPEGLE